jgi:pimeloyl-ACP methyl ester carboxylesterase
MNLRRWGLMAALSALASTAIAAPPPGIPDGWSEGVVYANGVRIHYYHAIPEPGKPVIVMVHGVTDNGLCWTTLTQEIQKSYDIFMMDSRGHGLSDPFTDADDGDTLIKDVVGFVHAMNFKKPILLGHSMGAATVMRIGAEYPDLPRAVIMLDPLLARMPGGALGGPSRPVAAAGDARVRPPAAPRALTMFGPPEALIAQNDKPFEDLVATCRKQNTKWDAVDCQYWALSKKQYHGPYSAAQMQAMSNTMQLGDSLAKITAPALILKADAPPDVRKANEKAAAVIQHGKLVHIDGAAHNLHHDQRKRTVEELTAFIDTL